ncbi:MAG: TonB-dependent receptor [Bacteroidota bacterium]
MVVERFFNSSSSFASFARQAKYLVSRLIAITVLVLSVSSQLIAQSTGSVSGYVKDAKTGEGLVGATVILEDAKIGTTTDVDGFYELKGVEPKTYNVTAKYLGYQPTTLYNVIVRSAGTPSVNFSLVEATETLGEVIIQARSLKAIITPLSSQTLSAVEIATYPGGNNDIAKVVQSLPGVSGSIGGFRNDVIIRGGAPNENVYFLDGVEIPNINHFATQGSAGGPIGLLNVSFIEDVDLATSAFNARYDNALSGVLQFNQRVGSQREFKGNVRVSSSETALTLEGPLFRKDKEKPARTSYLISGRRSYLQLLFDLIGLPILPDYWDYQYKITHQFDDYNELNLIGVGSIDDLAVNAIEEFDPEQQAAQEQVPVIRQWTTTAGLSYLRRFKSGSGNFRSTFSTNILNNEFTRFRDNVAETGVLFQNDSRESEIKWRNQLTNYVGNWIISSGFSLQRAAYTNRTLNQIDSISFEAELDFYRYGLFVQAARSLLNNRLDLSMGLRADANTFIEQENQLIETISPRIGLSYALDKANRWRLSGSVGVYYKIPPFTILGFQNTAGTFLNQETRYIRSIHYVAGLEFTPRPSTTISLEGFWKRYSDYSVSVLDSTSLANKGAGFEVLGNEEVQSAGEGRTYGIELLIQQQFTGNFYGILAYTLFKSEFTGFNDTYRPSAWDSRHLLTFTGGYKFGNNWEVSLRYRFVGPTPYAPVDEEETLASYPALVLDFERLGTVELDGFNQADIRVDKKWNFKGISLNIFLEVQNAFAQEIPEPPVFGLDRDDVGDVIQPRQLVGIPINNGEALPTIGIVFDF